MERLNFKVDKNKCIKCGLCIKDCSRLVLQNDGNGYPHTETEACFGCQHCMAICPVGAISVFNQNPENVFASANMPSPESIETLIKMRRSCRNYKEENIDKEKMEKLKDILNWVPTGVNYRGLHFTFVENKETMDEIRSKLLNNLKSYAQNHKGDKLSYIYEQSVKSGKSVVLRNAPHMVVVSVDEDSPCKEIDPIIALSYFELYAQSLGLGTLWCGLGYWTIPNCKNIVDMFNLPENYEIAYVMLFGNPNVHYKRSIQPQKYSITSI